MSTRTVEHTLEAGHRPRRRRPLEDSVASGPERKDLTGAAGVTPGGDTVAAVLVFAAAAPRVDFADAQSHLVPLAYL